MKITIYSSGIIICLVNYRRSFMTLCILNKIQYQTVRRMKYIILIIDLYGQKIVIMSVFGIQSIGIHRMKKCQC